ncbi:hypothetical protein K470DRAFT_275975 [Piedraia hortae CBS 480.64]|uniref:HTH APSES-type domain-containing protein n=1 Tax=Piedraia hortae CBS 480.64 TaxID=1314780 RepID=A0A6A7C2N4_9PEZI|nr:hypothetical protein K470DRAFT_275975 [Piedraia hortae CBS 480.64]
MMARQLPEHRNPMLAEERAPPHEILVERRCLGQTELRVRPGQVGLTNATKQDNLGLLDYAHLRVPLPKDLSGSKIFTRGANRKFPEAYFLMRRSSDGYISATGMFKAAFPYAEPEEEADEKEYIKSMPNTSSEEVAGNVWVSPEAALQLAEEYGIALWIAALLDPSPISRGLDATRYIKSPPSYKGKLSMSDLGRTPERAAGTRRSKRAGNRERSESPIPAKTPTRAIKTPKSRRTRRDHTAEPFGPVEKTAPASETVTVEVEQKTRLSGNGEVEDTRVNVNMPKDHPNLAIPDDPQELLREARRMVAEAEKIGGVNKSSNKRKASELEADSDSETDSRPAPKRARVSIELRKERMRRRLVTGIAFSLAIGSLLPTFLANFG